MNPTPQQRKILLICLAVVVGSYVLRSMFDSDMEMAYRQQAIRAAQQRAKAKAIPIPPRVSATPAVPGTNPPAPARTPVSSGLPGIWQGKTAIMGRGLCTLRLELRENEPSHFSGFSSLACANFAPLMSQQDRNAAAALLNRMNAATAILSGTMDNGSIKFHVDKTIGANSNGCAATSFTLTPFCANQLAAEWQEDKCQGGHIILQKAKS
jgi:hypothetical protein